MWDLTTILSINNEAQRAFEEKNAYEAHQREEEKRRQGILEEEVAVFDGASYVRSVFKGKVDRHTPHSRSGEELPE